MGKWGHRKALKVFVAARQMPGFQSSLDDIYACVAIAKKDFEIP